MKVLKFGGSSVGSPALINRVIDIILGHDEKQIAAVVVSAFQGVTNELIDIAQRASRGDQGFASSAKRLEERHLEAINELLPVSHRSRALAQVKVWANNLDDVLQGVFLIRELSARTLDFIMSFGERFAAYITSQAIQARGVDASFVDARELIKTDESFGSAFVLFDITYEKVIRHYGSSSGLQIVSGFIGSTMKDETTTLGRGGSDYTASIFGAALGASVVEIWTDVDGVMTADPRKVKKAFPLDKMTYEEAMELSHFGAKVIYPPTMQPAQEKKIPILIKNTFNPDAPGTVVGTEPSDRPYPVTGISSIDNVTLLRVQGSGMIGVAGVAMRLFSALAKGKISVILITQASSEHTICLAVDPTTSDRAKVLIEEEFSSELYTKRIDRVLIERSFSIVSVVGERMSQNPGVAAKVFGALGKNGINISAIAQGSSERNISIVVESAQETKALSALHEEFFLSSTKSLNLFVVGTGSIVSTLLRQIEDHHKSLIDHHHLDVQILGLTNRRKMILDRRGIQRAHCLELLETSESQGDLKAFVHTMKQLNVPNCVFVDCTASEEVTDFYQEILEAHISIVTPNKKAQSGSSTDYQKLKHTAQTTGAIFLFETSVGAGLPVISTLNDLLRSGDEIIKIEAVLSGTISFIFNSLSANAPFSEIVRDAKRRGFTEPDPRDDLNGIDVARKLIILARECGFLLEHGDVSIENLVPERCREASSPEAFLTLLAGYDTEFEEKRKRAEDQGKRLRYIALLEQGKASISLQAVDREHPFYSLSGSDNIISFTSKRYNERPLVVKGPGAGAEVTAAGVFADIIRLSHYDLY